MLGLGSIVGTGVFVSVGLAADIAGAGAVVAVAIAAGVAACNGLSSAQLAAAHPVSGGSYEYGYRLLHPAVGFTAGWLFVCAKTASAATAALGFAGYIAAALGADGRWMAIAIAVTACAGVTALVAGGVERSSRVNAVIVSIALVALIAFVVAGASRAADAAAALPWADSLSSRRLLEATALMFVAYTGYGRIATLGEEVREPRRVIPRAIVIALAVSMVLYIAVAMVAIAAIGPERLGAAARTGGAPLTEAARGLGHPALAWAIAVGAAAAMLGVLLNLVLGVSRVILAMARRRDLPSRLARVRQATGSPRAAVVATGVLIVALIAVGDVRATWSFSAFTVLVYYAITNLAALRLPAGSRLFPRPIAVAGLVACAGLAFWVEARVWLIGLAVIAAGLIWFTVARALVRRG